MHSGSSTRKGPPPRFSSWQATGAADRTRFACSVVSSPQPAPEVGRPPTVRRPLWAAAKQCTTQLHQLPWRQKAPCGTAQPSSQRKGPAHRKEIGASHSASRPQPDCRLVASPVPPTKVTPASTAPTSLPLSYQPCPTIPKRPANRRGFPPTSGACLWVGGLCPPNKSWRAKLAP